MSVGVGGGGGLGNDGREWWWKRQMSVCVIEFVKLELG